LLNKIIEEVKKTESTADNIIKEADDKAEKITNNAHEEADKLIERIKEETKKEDRKTKLIDILFSSCYFIKVSSNSYFYRVSR